MGKKNEPMVYDEVPGNFEIGKGVRLAEGSRVCLIGTGNIIHEVVAAGRRLNGEGVFHRIPAVDQSPISRRWRPQFRAQQHLCP